MQRVDLRGGDVERLLDEDVQAAPHRGDRLLGVQARRAADGDDVHRVREKGVEVGYDRRTGRVRQRRGLVAVLAVDGDDLDAVNRQRRRTCVSLMPPAPRIPIRTAVGRFANRPYFVS